MSTTHKEKTGMSALASYRIVNGESGRAHKTVRALNEVDALRQFVAVDERIVQMVGRGPHRPYVTGDHGVCYIAERV